VFETVKGSDIMGGRGASSGMSKAGKKYGSEYTTVYQSGNIKFVKQNEKTSITAPMETVTNGRVYVTLGGDGEPKHISFYDNDLKRKKQIDLTGKEHIIDGKGELPHTHYGYFHDENGTTKLSSEDQRIVDKVKVIWENYKRRK